MRQDEPRQPPAGVDAARETFAAFPAELQRAMRQAAKVERWTPEQWRDEVRIVEEIRVQAGYAVAANRAVEKIYLAVVAKAPVRPSVRPSKARNGIECYP